MSWVESAWLNSNSVDSTQSVSSQVGLSQLGFVHLESHWEVDQIRFRLGQVSSSRFVSTRESIQLVLPRVGSSLLGLVQIESCRVNSISSISAWIKSAWLNSCWELLSQLDKILLRLNLVSLICLIGTLSRLDSFWQICLELSQVSSSRLFSAWQSTRFVLARVGTSRLASTRFALSRLD